MKIQTLPIAAALRDGRWPAATRTMPGFGFTPDEIGELQAVLAASASMDSWIEVHRTATCGVIAPATATDGPPAVHEDQQPT